MTEHRLFTSDPQEISAAPATPLTIVIPGENGQFLLKIHPNGTLEYGPGYTPDEAARRFWDAVRQAARIHPRGGY